jgi:hypothetical protein
LFILEIHRKTSLFQMDDNHDNFMTDIIDSGTNTIATFTDEECSHADMYLNIREDDVAPVEDTTTNIEDNSRNNDESLMNVCVCIYIMH